MARTAEYSIKGYLYQFLLYLQEILLSEEGPSVTIEGAIEDIDVNAGTYSKAVQCKYHETVETYSLGKIYKPILLMMEHFGANPSPIIPVEYVLFCYFPGKTGETKLSSEEIATILATTDQKLSKIAGRIAQFDSQEFLSRFRLVFGRSFDQLEGLVQELLVEESFSPDDVKSIIYPAAFQKVADTSIRADIALRSIEKTPFVQSLTSLKTTTLTRWTRELSTRAKIFKNLRLTFNASLSPNARRRYFVINPNEIKDFDYSIAKLLKKYIEKYSSKFLHTHAPVFIINDPSFDLTKLIDRLFDIKIRVNDGNVGSQFREERFFADPIIKRTKSDGIVRDFQVSATTVANIASFDKKKPDDLFLINSEPEAWKLPDVDLYCADVTSLIELEYLLKLRDSYE